MNNPSLTRYLVLKLAFNQVILFVKMWFGWSFDIFGTNDMFVCSVSGAGAHRCLLYPAPFSSPPPPLRSRPSLDPHLPYPAE